MVLVTIAFIALLQVLGLTLSLFLSMAAALWLMGVRRTWVIFAIAFGVAASAYLLFILVLDAGFPHGLVEKLRSMIDAGQLKVAIRNGRMIIVLPNDVLFDSGKVDLKPAGKEALTQVANVLAGIGDRRFLVAGHTDNVPIKTSRFPSNWELSTARAVEVAK